MPKNHRNGLKAGRNKHSPKTKYKWETMEKGDTRFGKSRESLMSAFRSFFRTRNKKATFTTWRVGNQFAIQRKS